MVSFWDIKKLSLFLKSEKTSKHQFKMASQYKRQGNKSISINNLTEDKQNG